MRLFYILSLIALLVSCQDSGNNSEENTAETTTYYFIRHAEKATDDLENEDPDLTEEGRDRANKWAEVFKDIDFDLVYSSDYKRTLNTAKPIAEAKDLEINFFNTEILNDKEFQKTTKGKKVLVVGHSNLNPEWVNYILEEERYDDLDESVYGSLFIVTIHPDDSRSAEVLYID